MKPTDLVQFQLDSYNNHAIEQFLQCYSDNVEVFNFPHELLYKGKEKMREIYTNVWADNPGQHADLIKRISMGNTVVDQELVSGKTDGTIINALVIYKIEGDKIISVYFIRE